MIPEFVKFHKGGYDYSGVSGEVNEDSQHKFLFNYVAKDISNLPLLLKQYFSKKMDITTDEFELNDYEYTKADRDEIEKILADLHPYCKNNVAVFIRAIVDYFNDLLVQSGRGNKILTRLEEDSTGFEDFESNFERFNGLTDDEFEVTRFEEVHRKELNYLEVEQEWYRNKLICFIGPLLWTYIRYTKEKSENIINGFWEDYIDRVKQGTDGTRAKGFAHELKTQEIVRRMLFWIFDISAPLPAVNELTIPQRAWLYTHIFKHDLEQYRTDAKRHLFLSAFAGDDIGRGKNILNTTVDGRSNGEFDVIIDFMYAEFLNTPYNFNRDPDNIPENAQKALIKAAEYAAKASEEEIYEVYEITDLRQLLFIEILSMVNAGTRIKKCKNCGLYFVATKNNVEYCDRIAVSQGEKKPCKDIGSERAFREKAKKDEAYQIYRREFHRRNARDRRRYENKKSEKFLKWKRDAQEKLKEFRDKKIDFETFVEWLKKDK